MEAITYLATFDTPQKNGQKLAKIGKDKMMVLKGKYKTFLDTLVKPAETVTKPEPVVPKAPIVETEINNIPVTPVAIANNYNEVANNFGMKIYTKSFDELSLTGARKIRVNPKVSRHVNLFSEKLGSGKLDNTVVNNIKEDINISDTADFLTTPVTKNETVDINTSNLETSVKENGLPSVDDYLQKEVPNADNGIIIQLSGDVEKLKEEALKRQDILAQLESQYNDLKNQREKRIKELEEEKLSYTATLEGLTDKIKDLQDAISKERQTLGR